MRLLLASLVLLVMEVAFLLVRSATDSRAARDLLGAVLLLALLVYLAYLVSIKEN